MQIVNYKFAIKMLMECFNLWRLPPVGEDCFGYISFKKQTPQLSFFRFLLLFM